MSLSNSKNVPEGLTAAESLEEEYRRHDRELKKVRKFVREMSPKREFEAAFLKCFDQMYRWAHAAEELLKQSSYKAFYQESIQNDITFKIPKGKHKIEMIYEAPWKRLGAILSLLGILGFFGITIRKKV